MNDIETRLQDDAAALERIKLSEDDRGAFQQALAHTRQDTAPIKKTESRQYGWWLSGIAAAAVTAAVMIIADAPRQDAPVMPVAEQVITVPSEQPRSLRPLAEFVQLEQVSQAAALEEEWLNIQKDLAQARDTIESELPVRF